MYIYDPQSTALQGLGANNGLLYGLGKRPEVVSPAAQAAEVKRLTEELIKHAGERKWASVERAYNKLETMEGEAFNSIPKGLASAAAIHELGAQAADALGNIKLKQTRLLLAKRSLETTSPIDDVALRRIIDSLDAIEKAYGSVAIAPRSAPASKRQHKRLQGHGPKLTRVAQPGEQLFVPDQLRSIEAAAKVIQEEGSFDGLLPAGRYTLADQAFTINAGTELTGKKRTTILWGN
jgi:hypothetical protein